MLTYNVVYKVKEEDWLIRQGKFQNQLLGNHQAYLIVIGHHQIPEKIFMLIFLSSGVPNIKTLTLARCDGGLCSDFQISVYLKPRLNHRMGSLVLISYSVVIWVLFTFHLSCEHDQETDERSQMYCLGQVEQKQDGLLLASFPECGFQTELYWKCNLEELVYFTRLYGAFETVPVRFWLFHTVHFHDCRSTFFHFIHPDFYLQFRRSIFGFEYSFLGLLFFI